MEIIKKKRFSIFGINISEISRLVSLKEKKEIFEKCNAGNIDVLVRFNEPVDIGGTPQFLITNQTSSSRNITCNYLSGTGTNELTFRKTIAAGNAATNANDVLKVVANPVSLNGGTIKDAGTNSASTITSVLAIGTAAGTLTVSA